MDSPYLPGPPAPAAPKTSGLAIVSLVTSLLCLGPVAVILGHIALSRINRSAGTLSGRGLAIAGLAIGYLAFIAYFTLLPVLFVGARAWVRGSDRAACMINQRSIEEVVRTYQATHSLAPGTPLNLEEISASLPTPPTLTCPSGTAYDFSPTIPENGTPISSCSKPDHNLQH